MKAAKYTSYGKPEVVKMMEIPTPNPKENEILVKVIATTVTAGDWRMRAGNPFIMRFYNGFFHIKRTILGHEFSGVVESVGNNVSHLKKGDPVFGYTGSNAGAHAEYVVLNEIAVISHKPTKIEDTIAAALPVGASTALHFLKKANIKQGQKVLIYGASGSVGTYAVQLARHFGASVTAVCSKANSDLVQSLGAEKVIDYQKQDFTKGHEKYDIIFDAVGKTSFGKSKKVLNSGGAFLTVGMDISLLFQSITNAVTKKYRIISGVAKIKADELQFLTKLIENGVLKPVIDSIYSLSEIQKAHERAESGHKRGNIVIINNHAN